MRKFVMGGVLVLVLFLSSNARAADVNVYGEAVYEQNMVMVEIYADIDEAVRLCSAGVRLLYDPSRLEVYTALKNDQVWYFGNETVKYPYMNPDYKTTAGEVVIILGKLDTRLPTEGVTGSRVLLGRVVLKPVAGSSLTGDPAQDIKGLTYGRGDGTSTFENFVTVNSRVMDKTNGVAFGPIRKK